MSLKTLVQKYLDDQPVRGSGWIWIGLTAKVSIDTYTKVERVPTYGQSIGSRTTDSEKGRPQGTVGTPVIKLSGSWKFAAQRREHITFDPEQTRLR